MVIAAKDRSVVFDDFPLSEGIYVKDVRPLIQPLILRYGMSEWRAAVLTNELHGHLGIYSLLGVKMGCLALEQFPAGDEPLTVLSYAGSATPLSCLNDGLQTSTGATLGHGTIRLCEGEPAAAKALFCKGEGRVLLTLKEQTARQIAADIALGRKQHGLRSNGYWVYIRRLALRYWLEFDRHEIFERVVEHPPKSGGEAAR